MFRIKYSAIREKVKQKQEKAYKVKWTDIYSMV